MNQSRQAASSRPTRVGGCFSRIRLVGPLALSLAVLACEAGTEPTAEPEQKPESASSSGAARPAAKTQPVAEAKPAANEDLEKLSNAQLAERVYKATGADDMISKLGEQMKSAMQKQAVSLAPGVNVEDYFGGEFLDKIRAITIPIYAKHLSKEEMTGLVRFYSSPSGRALLEKMPVIQQEIMMQFRELGQGIAKEMMAKAQAAPASSP